MAEFSSHIPGSFSWVELSTTDQKAGVAFYRALLGWGVNEIPIGPADVYSMFTLRDLEVAAAATQQDDERKMGVPPHWNMYVTVADVDESVKKAQSLGANVLAPAFDVMDAGRMAVLQDPTGAVFQVWQAKNHIGAKILSEPGSLCWTELSTRDTKAAEKFYTQLFGWTVKHSSPDSQMEYTEFENQGQHLIGMMPMPAQMPASVPAHWLPYFQVENCDASTEKARALGANVLVAPQDIPKTGRFSVIADPQGAACALFTLGA